MSYDDWKASLIHRSLVPGCVTALCALGVTAAAAQVDRVISIPIDTVVFAEPGSLTVVASAPVADSLVGTRCEPVVEADNNSSVHPDNDLIVESDGTSVELADVEGSPGKVTIGDGVLVLGPTVSITLRMGAHGVFSAGFFLDCRVPIPPSTTAPAVTTTAAASIPPPSTSTISSNPMPTISVPVTTAAPSVPSTVAPVAVAVAPSDTSATRVLPKVQESPAPEPVVAPPAFAG